MTCNINVSLPPKVYCFSKFIINFFFFFFACSVSCYDENNIFVSFLQSWRHLLKSEKQSIVQSSFCFILKVWAISVVFDKMGSLETKSNPISIHKYKMCIIYNILQRKIQLGHFLFNGKFVGVISKSDMVFFEVS